jgi:hypothetical protein
VATLFFNPAACAAHFAAAGLYPGVALAAGAGGAALSPAKAGAEGGGGRATRERAPADAGQGRTIAPVQQVVNYYAPVFGGREGTQAEAGEHMDRYRRAADARLVRERS